MISGANRVARRLIALTKLERAILTSGRLEELGAIEEVKARLIARFLELGGRAETSLLQKLRDQSRENHRLYSASLLGIKKVRDQIDVLSNGGAELRTYGADGARRALADPAPKKQHRA